MNKLTSELTNFIRSNYSPEEKVKQSKNGNVTTFFRKGGKSLCYITTKDGKPVVVVVIGASLNDKIQSANISKKTKEMFDNAKQFHDGKWLVFELKTKREIEDIKSLLMIKRTPTQK